MIIIYYNDLICKYTLTQKIRVPCDYKKKNMAVRVEESSQKPHYLAIKLLYQGGQTQIEAMDVAKVSSIPLNKSNF